MAGYVFGVLVLLLLWGAGLERVMAYAGTRFLLMTNLALVYRAIGLAVGYLLTILMTELVLPHSKLASAWTLEQMQAAMRASHVLGGMLVVGLFGLAYRRLLPRLPQAGRKAESAAAAKPRLKSVGAGGRNTPKRQA